jgi:hypothetical protein
MAGVKGRSGRRTTNCEEKRLAVIDKAWDIVFEALNSETLTLKEKAAIAEKIVVKNIPQEVGVTMKSLTLQEAQERAKRLQQ